ncbi:MAG TPA: bifunctional helix-turn-helix transcriptional regulator/GNAT family N-acetyltransferase [Kofleriaceae bacterium]|nr:bifunctional helix-turn-helix transcriptional regulator/GNAT family N-acetyltransferase [Kofleriaceae bacterium]
MVDDVNQVIDTVSVRNNDRHVAAVRAFNRFYTQLIGALDEGHLSSEFSLVEVRLLYEVAHAGTITASALCETLALDPGYASRLVRRLSRQGLLSRAPSREDGRAHPLELTARGRKTVAELERRARRAVELLLARVPGSVQPRVLAAMQTIRRALEPSSTQHVSPVPYMLRDHRPGDIGWIVHRHGVLYAEEYGWDERFEALVARVASDFITKLQPRRERCWIAERDGEIVGSVFLVARSRTVAQLRLLYVEPAARGLGIGTRLVQECTRFARLARYRKIMLWTNSILRSARRIYEAEGYRLVDEAPHDEFGTNLIGQTFELSLNA